MSNLTQIFDVDCCVCSTRQKITAPLEQKEPPTNVVCPFCLQALGALYRDKEIESVRVARIKFPGDAEFWLIASDDSYDSSKFGRIKHGDVFESDIVHADADENDETYLNGELNRRIKEGLVDFEVDRSYLEDSHPAKAVLDHILDLAGQRLEVTSE